jgi:DNA-binding transcriptional LysR family regulator
MDLWQLNVFCRVVDHKSFSKAALAIHLSQPTVSSHIKDLEEHFGCVLIDRMGKEALPTPAGLLLYRYARKLLSLRDETESAMSQFQGKIKGRLSIGGSTIPGGFLLPRFIGEFKKKLPEATVSLVVGDTESIIDDILAGEVELGIVGASTDNKKIFQEKLIDDNMRLIVPKNHRWASRTQVSLEMLQQEPFIIREKGSGTLKSFQECLENVGGGIDGLKIVAQMGSTVSVIQGIKHNVGVSVLSTISVTEELNAGALKALKVEGLNLTRSFYLTRHKLRSLSPLAEAFFSFVGEAVKLPGFTR